MVKNKQKFALWLTPEAKAQVEANFHADNCQSQSEFIEKAIWFYTGYLNCERAGAYLPRVMSEVVGGTLNALADRMGRLMFKQAVEQNMTNNILAIDCDMDDATYQHYRGKCVREVRESNGAISFKDALHFQREAW